MPSIETACRHQKAVLWMANSFNDQGEQTIGAAVSLDVRHEIGHRSMTNPKGKLIAVDSIAVVDRAITVGSIFWPGNLDDVADPPVDLLRVAAYAETPDVKGRDIRRTIGLVRYDNALPDLA